MGRAKEAQIEKEENLNAAAEYLVEKEVLEQCEYHGTIYGGGFLELDADFWRDVTVDWRRGDSGPVPWASGMKVQDFRDLLKEAYEANCGDGCYSCEKNMED